MYTGLVAVRNILNKVKFCMQQKLTVIEHARSCCKAASSANVDGGFTSRWSFGSLAMSQNNNIFMCLHPRKEG